MASFSPIANDALFTFVSRALRIWLYKANGRGRGENTRFWGMNQKLDTARVFERIFEIYRSQFTLLIPAALLVFVPVAVISGLISAGRHRHPRRA